MTHQVTGGMATLGPGALRVLAQLESRFLDWAAGCGAVEMRFPPLLATGDLARLDYLQNFPHLALVATPIAAAALPGAGALTAIPPGDLAPGDHLLPSAACYSVYLHLGGRTLERSARVTTVATCFRNEAELQGLARLRAFTMREIVCVGTAEDTSAHLDAFRARIAAFAASLDLPLEVQVATDPFYAGQEARRQLQLLAPVKHEFVARGGVAIASLNRHRNFFGERCAIRTADGGAAFSSCVAFGLERWLHALLDRFGDEERAAEALARAG